MSRPALIAVSGAGEMAVWRVADTGQPHHFVPQRGWLRQMGAFCLGLLATAVGAGCIWQYAPPDTVIQTRIVAEGATDTAGRAALSDLVLRLAATPARASLQGGGEALDVTVQDNDPAVAEQRSRSLVDALLNVPVMRLSVAQPSAPDAPGSRLRAERTRLAAAADALEARSAIVSATLAGVARDMAATSRGVAERKPGRETLEKGEAALADLQLQRLQLASKYQDTYPAVLALDQQIRNLRVFMIDEAHRLEIRPAAATPPDTLLNGERDRLRLELAQVDDRRGRLATDLFGIDRRLAALPAPVSAVSNPVASPVLVTAATTNFAAADIRPGLMAKTIAAGLFLSGLVAIMARPRPAPFRHRVLLDQVSEQLIAAPGPSRTLVAAPVEAALGQPTARGDWLRQTQRRQTLETSR